jgi:hypothetical protein
MLTPAIVLVRALCGSHKFRMNVRFGFGPLEPRRRRGAVQVFNGKLSKLEVELQSKLPHAKPGLI